VHLVGGCCLFSHYATMHHWVQLICTFIILVGAKKRCTHYKWYNLETISSVAWDAIRGMHSLWETNIAIENGSTLHKITI